jgi:hypothetical protein
MRDDAGAKEGGWESLKEPTGRKLSAGPNTVRGF